MKRLRVIKVAAVMALLLGNIASNALAEESAGKITVTGTREGELASETSATVGVISGEEVQDVKAGHPSEIMNRVPGVWVNVTGGEGHMTSIRQPLTTAPVYLYLEDGIPTRSTGFFNHNALYEVNVPMAGGIEVTKGPGTSLYGSDAIGGIVNVLTKPAPLKREAEINLEAGDFGWTRALVSAGDSFGNHGIRADVNVTHTDGWRDATAYDRQSVTLRGDSFLDSGLSVKTLVAYSKIDQQTAGTSRLSEEDYENNPTLNYTPISYRDVGALRISAAIEKEKGDSLVSVTPYFRQNSLGYLANWSLSYDPTILETNNNSYGLMAKYRKDFEQMRTRVIGGVDIDQSPGSQNEQKISPLKEDGFYTDYTAEETVYDYDVTYMGVAPYLHAETSPSDRLRLNGGLRYDSISYDYTNNLDAVDTGKHRRADSIKVSYTHLSPKVGATYGITPDLNGFASYKHAFRAPSQSQLFRQGKADNTVDLTPVKVDSYEFGFRGNLSENGSWEVSLYNMTKTDDILSYKFDDGTRETRNAGETLHQGIEIGTKVNPSEWFNLALSLSYAEHTFVDWKPDATVDYSGNEISAAPKVIGNAIFGFTPEAMGGGKVELEYVRLGEYYLDNANTEKYDGHSLYNLRADYPVGAVKLYGRVMNLTDERWATAGAYNTYRGTELAPGMPLTWFAGITYDFM